MQLTVELDYAGDGWYQEVDAPAFNEVSSILEHVYGREVQFINSGGGLPLVSLLASVNKPKTPVVLYGAYDPESHIHGHNESVSIETLRQNVKATIYFLSAMGNH